MFEQHPVPQQISSYQFRLVGDMTLKQFFQLAAGAAIGLLIYATPLPSIFKWPLIILFVIAGAAFAFLPLQERPLEEWLSAFFRAIYGPTLFNWRKNRNIQYFATDTGATNTPPGTAVAAPSDASVAKLEASETSFLNNISGMFGIHPKSAAPVQPAGIVPTPVLPTVTPVAVSTQQGPRATILNSEATITHAATHTGPQDQTPKAGTLFVATPATPQISVPKTQVQIDEEKAAQDKANTMSTGMVSQTLHESESAASAQAQFSPDAAPPSPATIPNVIVGQVMTADGHIVEGAIIEVTDYQGRPVRALKTNRAGHFMIVTPLPNGQYKMVIEKDGQQFESLSFEAHGVVIPPIAIRAQQSTV